MTLAFVFLNCDIGTEKAVMGEMNRISGVSEAIGVSGVYDIVAKLHADSNGGITNILKRFHTIAHVRSCSTMIVAEELHDWQYDK
ncbi:Lrp/AsnC family transcriptional regulator [Nitrososphaera viennensis]|uniref:Lrp/AsnC family transcriptional regulator n=2 Tax=Nitrososphaera viennensis TaxID=1034015 RepID=A0A977ICB9_9ARCH|nr:Lrp/AsnC family transcriptional regulator [Nitrososphaera viennensis]AIC16211.1 putative transcriptional regulator, AsnC family [Nitrososphaera viennensis EN76]UVS68157.1 Lrp/AsnC family transcriptional regulator [Nitrososphaera viennensis]